MMNERNQTKFIINLFFSVITIHALTYALKISGTEIEYDYPSLISSDNLQTLKDTASKSVLTGSILSIPIIYGLYCFFSLVSRNLTKREFFESLPIGFFMSSALVFGTNLYFEDVLVVDSAIENTFHIFELTPLTTGMVICAFRLFPKLDSILQSNVLLQSLASYLLNKTFIKTFFVFSLSWGALLFFVFPGIYATDAGWQYDWYLKGQISAHHPPLHTFWLGACIEFGRNFFESTQLGLFVYSISQLLLSSALMAYFYENIKNCLPKQYLPIFIVFTAVMPINPVMALLASKDVIFSMLFINCCLFFYQLANDNRLLLQPLFIFKCFIFALLMCLFRNNGIYAFTVGVALMYFFVKDHKLRFFSLFVFVFIVFSLVQITFKVSGISPAPIKMMLSVPVQQIARVYRDQPQCVASIEKQKILDYIPNIQLYSPRISDNALLNFNESKFKKSPEDFFIMWFKLGKCAPTTYLNAFMSNTIGLWYPDMIYRDPGAWHPYLPYHDNNFEYGLFHVPQIPRKNFFDWEPSIYETLENSAYYQKIPLVSFLFNPGCYLWLYILYAFYCFRSRKYSQLAPFSLLFGLYATLLMGPVVLIRYVYPFMLAIPFVFMRDKSELGVDTNVISFNRYY